MLGHNISDSNEQCDTPIKKWNGKEPRERTIYVQTIQIKIAGKNQWRNSEYLADGLEKLTHYIWRYITHTTLKGNEFQMRQKSKQER